MPIALAMPLWTSLATGLTLSMKKHDVTIPEIGLIAATRAMLGAGVALLLCDKLAPEQRRAIGWTLVAVGVLTTFPLALEAFGNQEKEAGADSPRETFQLL